MLGHKCCVHSQSLAHPNSSAFALTVSHFFPSPLNCHFSFQFRLCTQVNQICSHLLASDYVVIPQISSSTWVQGPPQIPKSLVAQVSDIKWHRTMTTSLHIHRFQTAVPTRIQNTVFHPPLVESTNVKPADNRANYTLSFLCDAGNTDCKSYIFFKLTIPFYSFFLSIFNAFQILISLGGKCILCFGLQKSFNTECFLLTDKQKPATNIVLHFP